MIDFFKLFKKGKKNSDQERCVVCGKYFPKEELHKILLYFSTKQSFYVCDSCIELPPSEWFKWRRK